jgi:hypothetical protein
VNTAATQVMIVSVYAVLLGVRRRQGEGGVGRGGHHVGEQRQEQRGHGSRDRDERPDEGPPPPHGHGTRRQALPARAPAATTAATTTAVEPVDTLMVVEQDDREHLPRPAPSLDRQTACVVPDVTHRS